MELIIKAPTEDGFIKAIEWNHEEIKAELQEKVAVYTNMVYDDDQVKEAKADRAELNKFKKALEDKRKEVKAKCLAPYEAFEKQMKEITAIIDEPIGVIDRQVKDFEEKVKEAKRQEIRDYFNTKDFHGFTFEEIEDSKWLNATTSMKSITEAIDKAASDIEADLQIINDLEEYTFEAIEVYKRGRDVRAALAEAKRLKEQAIAKAEFEAKRAAEAAAQAEAKEAEPEPIAEPETFPEIAQEIAKEEDEDWLPDFEAIPSARDWTAVKAFITPEDLEALKAFFDSHSIPYEIL